MLRSMIRRGDNTADHRGERNLAKKMDTQLPVGTSYQTANDAETHAGFQPVANEIERQFDLEMEFDSSSDTKIGIFLGFIVIVIVQLAFATDLDGIGDQGAVSFILFFTGLQWIAISGWKALVAYGPRKYPVGHDLGNLIRHYSQTREMRNDAIYSQMYISSKIEEAGLLVQVMMEEKKRLMKSMQNYFFFGVIVVLLSQVFSMVVV